MHFLSFYGTAGRSCFINYIAVFDGYFWYPTPKNGIQEGSVKSLDKTEDVEIKKGHH